ncbi:hypothetical protein ACQ4PT_051439 [Festuca glaucescens]
MGSLLPEKSDSPDSVGGRKRPKFAELYIYDTTNEVNNRIDAINPDNDKNKDLDPVIVTGLTEMLNECNDLVKKFRMASERIKGNEDEHVAIRLVAPSEGDGPQYSLPSTNHLAALLVGPLDLEAPTRDIVIHNRQEGLERISCLHPAFMSLQYPLLFPYAERGFHLDIPYLPTVLYTVEFQKRGLLHAHILIWLKRSDTEVSMTFIDSFVSAEIPDPNEDPLGYILVSEFMMHGPCGDLNDKCVCMKDEKCSKHFPKDFQQETVLDKDGYALYMRRDNGRRVFKNGKWLNNQWVVPYNLAMLKKYQGHMNVEWCNKAIVMKYLFKYVTKGPDFSKVYLQRIRGKGVHVDSDGRPLVNEVYEYLESRYICEYDAFWRIYGFTIHGKTPSVERLPVHLPGASVELQREISLFSDWVLDLGEGKLPPATRGSETVPNLVDIPDDLLIHTEGDHITAIISTVYPDFASNFQDFSYLRQRAVLAPTNDLAEQINSRVLEMLPCEGREYLSSDSKSSPAGTINEEDLFYPPDVLNAIEIPNFPAHRLFLKEGAPIMLLRNLSQSTGLCNGTRLIILELADRVLKAVIITGSHVGDVVYIPRIELTTKKTKWPFILLRRQFPIRVSYAMTINKSQGQTLDSVGLYLKTPVFSHGQLYVDVSRVTSRQSLKILIVDEDGTCGSQTKNVVYPEMAINLLTELVKGNRGWTIHVFVSRLWLHRGATDDGPVKHMDAVFQDTEGNHIYAEISVNLVNQFVERLKEGKVYELRRFLVTEMKTLYKAVEADYMIRFGRYTTVKELDDDLMNYPMCTYALSPLDDLSNPTDTPTSFTGYVSSFGRLHSLVYLGPLLCAMLL